MPEAQPLVTNMSGMELPKYSSWSWQLSRLEQLLDQCLNSYTQLDISAGREKFISALEAFYIALSPHLKKEDREQVSTWKEYVRNKVNRLNAEAQTRSISTQEVNALRRTAGQVLEMMNLLKDKRGFGIPRKEKEDWKEELAHALDLQVKAADKPAEKAEP